MEVEEKLKKLGFEQILPLHYQRLNEKLDVKVYVIHGKISAVEICKFWCPEWQSLSDYDAYLSKVKNLMNKLNNISKEKE